MRVHRGYLFWGIFLILLGGIPLAERAGLIEGDQLGQVGRLWPLALVAIGVAIVVARSRVSLVGTVVTALVLGGLAGGALAYGSGWAFDLGDCAGVSDRQLDRTTQSGAFSASATVDLELNCGTLDLQAGTVTSSLGGWSLDARHRDAPPIVTASDTALSIRSPESTARRQEWTLFLPGPQVRSIAINANAASAVVDVTGAELSSLALEVNAADARVLATDATVGALAVEGNASRVRLSVTSGTVRLQMNASAVDLCATPGSALTVTVDDGFALVTNLESEGLLEGPEGTWSRSGTGTATLSIEVEGNASSFTLDPEAGC
jgi:Domain of unknown function (DUF5668)